MKKRITSLLLTLAMLLSLVPALGVTASAADDWKVVNSYAELKAALNGDRSANIKLGRDIDTKDEFPYGLTQYDTITTTKQFILDLNGKKLTLRSGTNGITTYIRVMRGSLTIQDTAGGGEIYLDQEDGTAGPNLFLVDGNFTMKSGKLTAVNGDGAPQRGPTLIKGNGGNIDIQGGEFSSTFADGSVCLYGGNVYTKYVFHQQKSCYVLDMRGAFGNVTISGGTFTGVLYINPGEDKTATISGGTFNNTVGLKVQDEEDKVWAEPVIRVTGGTFSDVYFLGRIDKNNSPCIFAPHATPTVAILISGGSFESGGIFKNYISSGSDGSINRLTSEKLYLPIQITGGTFGTLDLNTWVDITASESGAQVNTSQAFRHILDGSFVKTGNEVYASDNIFNVLPIVTFFGNDKGCFQFDAPVTIIPGGQVKATLDDESIGYYKDWKGPVEYLDNGTAHTLKFTWAPLPQEAKDAGYSYDIRFDYHASGAASPTTTITPDSNATEYSCTIHAGSDAGLHGYNLRLNLKKNGQFVGAMSNEHIVRIFLLNGTSTPYVRFSDVVTVDEAPPTASAVGSGYTVDSIGWFTDSGCSTQATAFTEGTAYYAKVVLKSSGNHVFVNDEGLGYPVVIPLCDGDNNNYSIVGRPTISDSGKTLTFVAKSTAIAPFVWESVDTANMTHTIGTTGVNLHAKAVGGDVSQYRYITYKLYTQKDGGEAKVEKSETTREEFTPVFWPAEAGVYTCWFEATRGFDTITSTPFTVTVSTPGLNIDNQSGDFTIMQGGYARLFVIAKSASSHQWQVENGGSWTDIPGATYYDYRAEPEEIGDHIYRCKLTNSYGEVAYSNEMTVTVLENSTLGKTPAYILPAVNEPAPDPAVLWPEKVIDYYDLQGQILTKKAEFNVNAGDTFRANANYSHIPGGEGYKLELSSGTQKGLYYKDFNSDEEETALLGQISYHWQVTGETDEWGFPTNYYTVGTGPIQDISIPAGVKTYWARLTITNTIGTGSNQKERSSYVGITFHVDQPGVGTAVSGTVASYGSAGDPVTVSLTKQGETAPAFTQTLTGASGPAPYSQSYSFSAVPAGEYILKVEKKGHAPWTETITVGTDNIGKDVTVYLLGDVNMSGSVTNLDANWIKQYKALLREFDSYQLLLADVNGSNSVTNLDANWILQYKAGLRDESYNLK